MPRTAPKKQRPANRDLSQLGIFAIPDLDVEGDDDDIGLDDDDLEAELSAILASGPTKPKAKRPPPKPAAAAVNLDAMVAESLRDLPSDDDSSADEDDPSLLAELSAVTGDGEVKDDKPLETMQPMTNSEMDTLKLLHERIAMYMQAEENSKAVGDTLKVRRLGRGLKTMNELVKKAEAGVIIDEADIPMPVSIIAKKPHEDDQTDKPPEIFAPLDMDTGLPAPLLPQRTAPTPPVPPPRASPEKSVPLAAAAMPSPPSSVVPIDDSVLKILIERRDQYKRAAVSAKRDGNTGEALGFVKIAKKFDSVIEEASKGRPVDLSTMPPPPPGFELPAASYEPPALPQVQEEADPPVPATVMEALEQRLAKFQQQEENAKAEGNSSKARRMGRIVNQYRDAIKLHRAGKPIPVDELPTPPGFAPIPVPASANPALPSSTTHIPGPGTLEPTSPSSSSVTPRPSPQPSLQVIGTSKQEKLALLLQKQNQLKGAALKAKEDGDLPLAKENLRQYRNLEQLLEAMKNEIPDELISQFDSAVEDAIAGRPINISALVSASQTQTTTLPTPNEVSSKANEVVPPISDTVEDPPIPATVMEALEQRLAKFQQQEENAKAEGNSSKARRMGRIVNQYRDAIKLHRAGKPIPVDELPTPPGFAPIPVPGASDNPALPSSTTHIPGPGKLEPTSPSSGSATPQRSPQPSLKGVGGTKQDKQLTVLLLKQKQFKEAALKAKQDGDLLLAKEFLRQYKSFDPLIEATQSGFPVDLTTLPAPPGSSQSIEKEFEVVKMVDCIPGTTSELYNQLITDLQQQLKLCMETRAHFKAIGDVGSANKFEHLAISSKKDLDTVKIACNKDEPVPKFHYERRTFNIVRCNTDLTDNEMEISIVQGVNYNVPNPKEIDTYVRFEFPAPSNEEPKRDKTSTVYNTNNPAYDAKFMIAIPRSNRNFQRLFKRHALKLEVWAKGCVLSSVCKFCKCCSLDRLPRGFLRSDSLVGTVSVKLLPLETKCTIHDSFDVMDGRKPLGGKLEVKIRIRHPVQSKQVEQLQEKWLVVD